MKTVRPYVRPVSKTTILGTVAAALVLCETQCDRSSSGNVPPTAPPVYDPSLCVNEDALKARACIDSCIAAIDVRQQTATADAESSCESRLSEGKGPLTCGLVTLPPAIKNALEGPRRITAPDTLLLFGRTLLLVEDFDTLIRGGDSSLGEPLNKVGGSGTARKFRQALNDAKGDDVTLDAAFARWIPSVFQLREATKTYVAILAERAPGAERHPFDQAVRGETARDRLLDVIRGELQLATSDEHDGKAA